jgi:chromosome segregation ATPase
VEEVINDWNVQLEQDATAFINEAVRVGEWDAQLRDNQQEITGLADQVQRLLLAQDELDRTMGSVSSNQQELDQTLEALEAQVDDLFDRRRSRTPDDADLERERMFQLAIDVDQQLSGMLGTLKGLVQGLNDSFDRANSSGSTVSKVVKILNAHQQALHWLETTSKKVEADLGTVNRQLKHTE